MMTDIKWPGGKTMVQLRKEIAPLTDEILTGRMLAIDPASGGSSLPGWAIYEAGQFKEGGTITLRSRDRVNQRLQVLMKRLQLDFQDVDVLVLEKIRGSRSHAYLKWSVGVTLASCDAPYYVEVPTGAWRAIRPENYVKTDAADAALIGRAAILMAREIEDEPSK